MACDVKHFFMCLLAICTSGKSLFISLTHFFTGSFIGRVYFFLSPLTVLDMSPLRIDGNFFPILCIVSSHLIVSFAIEKLLNLIKAHLLTSSIFGALEVLFKKSLPMPMSSRVLPILSSSRQVFFWWGGVL